MQSVKQEGKNAANYGLNLQRRERLTLSGVKEVVAFDENQVLLLTEGGELTIAGQSLHVDRLSLDSGDVELTGVVDSLVYDRVRSGKKGSLAARIFR